MICEYCIGATITAGAVTYHSESPRTYKVANVQVDAVFNKVGYHYPQDAEAEVWLPPRRDVGQG